MTMSDKGATGGDVVKTKAEAGTKRGQPKQGRVQSLQEKLAKIESEAEKLRQRLQEERRKERDGNARQITALVQKEDLAEFTIEAWRAALPKIRAALQEVAATAAT
jgi:hypothetical protein